MLRKIGAALAGVAVLGVVVMLLQYGGAMLHPLPEGLDPTDPAQADALAEHTSGMPAAVWALAFASEVLGAFFGAWTAAWVARDARLWFAGGIVTLALAGSVVNWISFPHPAWFIVGQVVLYPFALIGALRVTAGRGAA